MKPFLPIILTASLAASPSLFAASHREAPITALDHKADITDVYAFVSYGADQAPNTPPTRATLIMCVDPLLEPANGPTFFPFDPDIAYEIKIDNNNDAVEDVIVRFRFQTEIRNPAVFQSYVGIAGGKNAPANAPNGQAGMPVVPDRINDFNDAGIVLRQTYTATVTNAAGTLALANAGNTANFVVPNNIGPRTMDYPALFNAGINTSTTGVRTFAGTVDDPFYIDLGAAFDTFNLRSNVAPGALTPAQDASTTNLTSDTVSGYAVNAIAVELPITMLTRTGAVEPATSTAATIGVWATTSRPRITVRRSPNGSRSTGALRQIQRMANPLINELLVGLGSKDKWSMEQPKNDSQFAPTLLDPLLPRVINALTDGAVAIPAAPRNDLLPLVQYRPPIAAAGTPQGPVADLLRLNTGVPATPPGSASRLGVLGGDNAGFPNGRRLFDDVTDIALRVVVGGVLAAPFPGYTAGVNDRLGDGVNVNDAAYRTTFPYVADGPSGRNRRHLDPGEAGGGPAN